MDGCSAPLPPILGENTVSASRTTRPAVIGTLSCVRRTLQVAEGSCEARFAVRFWEHVRDGFKWIPDEQHSLAWDAIVGNVGGAGPQGGVLGGGQA